MSEKNKLSDFRTQAKNANRHTEYGGTTLERSMEENGWFTAMTSAADGEVFDGSFRLEKAAEKFGVDIEPIVVDIDGTRPVILRRTDISTAKDPRAVRAGVAANRVAELSLDWDEGVLGELLNENEDILDGLFNDDELVEFGLLEEPESGDAEPQIDRAEELREQWGVELGQIWQLGEHRIICGDCTDAAVVARVMGGEKADMVFTDPPYGVSYADKNKFLNAIDKGNSIQTAIENDHKTPEEMSVFWVNAFSTLRAFLNDGASYYVTAPQGGDLLLLLLLALKESDYPLRHMLIWAKNNHVLGRSDYNYKHEPIVFGWVKGTHRFYAKHDVSLWEIDRPSSSKLHPTMKPVELYERGIKNSTQKGEIVAEPFCGSGTCIIAAENLGRKCRAIEISPAYVAVTLERMAEAFPDIEIKRIE